MKSEKRIRKEIELIETLLDADSTIAEQFIIGTSKRYYLAQRLKILEWVLEDEEKVK